MSGVAYHDQCRPLLLTVYPDREMTDQEWIDYMNRINEYREAWGRMIMVLDAPGSKHLPNARQRALIAERTPGGDDETAAPTFVVLRSHTTRGVAKAIGWLSRKEYDLVYCASLEEALEKAKAWAQEAGIELAADPSVLLRYRAAI